MGALRSFVRMMSVVLFWPLAGCTESSPHDPMKTERPGFAATISGAVRGELSGRGLVTYIAPQETGSGTRPGYYLVSHVIQDRREARDWIVTLRIPDGTDSGTYQLVTADPRKVGEKFEARLEGVVDRQAVAFRSNTEGTLTLISFPSHAGQLPGATVTGRFQFSAENSRGDIAAVTGEFDFPVKA